MKSLVAAFKLQSFTGGVAVGLIELAEVREGIDFGAGEFPGSRNDYSPRSKELAEFMQGSACGAAWGQTWEPEMFGELLMCVMQPSLMRGFGSGASIELATPGAFSCDDEELPPDGPAEPISIDESSFSKGQALGAECARHLLTHHPDLADKVRPFTTSPNFLRGIAAGVLARVWIAQR